MVPAADAAHGRPSGVVRQRSVRQSGRRLVFLDAGPEDGPVLVLLHGLASDSGTWEPAITPLTARGLRVLALDLLGHGLSDKPPAGAHYSLAGFAASIVELLDTLDLPAATLAGHSLGGAIAIHTAFHHPARVDRLVLVSSGGLGRQVHVALRAAALPGAHAVLRAVVNSRTLPLLRARHLHRTLRLTPDDLVNLRRAGRALTAADGRAAFFTTLRSVIEPGGQRGSLLEMRYLTDRVPTLIVWSEADHVIPVAHARAVHAYLPASRLELFPGSSHEPHRRYAERFADVVAEFLATTAPARATEQAEHRTDPAR